MKKYFYIFILFFIQEQFSLVRMKKSMNHLLMVKAV